MRSSWEVVRMGQVSDKAGRGAVRARREVVRAGLATLMVLVVVLAGLSGGCVFGRRGPVSAVDDAGREIRLEHPPTKIVSMAPSNTEILFAIGLGDRVVGVTNYDNYPPEVSKIAKVGDFWTPDYEKIVSLAPDLVLAVGTPDSQLVKGLEAYGLKVFILQAATIDQVASDIELVGKVSGAEKQARKVAEETRARIQAVKAKVPEVGDAARPRVFWALDDKLWTVGPGSFVDDLITSAGGRNVAASLGLPYGQFSLESLLEADPDVIIIPVLDPSVPEALSRLAGWDSLKAVKDGRVYQIDPDIVSRPGPRIAQALEEVARLLYPDLFGK